ncbi:MAG TPA: hypothetical protein VHC92_12070 [Rhodanobacteraceae bacterium]|nr:hypothetical protein [Rhodanobacteraceae bacterium]
MRRLAIALALLASWILVLLWAARVDWRSPFSPEAEREFPGTDFTAVFGSASAVAEGLHVESAGEDFASLQSIAPSDLDAADFPTLRYRFSGFPRTLELSLVFRTADDPDVVAISLPWPGASTRTVDLHRVPEWRGRIVEIGFAEFPTAQQVPPQEGFKPFVLVGAHLWSRSWRGDLAALATDWLGAWPWTQRSVHALGRDTDAPRARPIVLAVAIAALLALGIFAFAFRARRRAFAWSAAVIVGVAWLALDVVWQAGLWGRLQTTRAVYAQRTWVEREHTVADTDTVAAAEALQTMLRDEPESSRILVYADQGGGYELLRFVWHLIPRNAALLAYASLYQSSLPDGCLIVFLDSDGWRTDSRWRDLLAHSDHLASRTSIHGDGFDSEPVTVFRFHPHAH